MITAAAQADDLLRCRGRFAPEAAAYPWSQLVMLAAAAGFGYGLVMGAFAGRPLQALYSGLKVPLLLGVTTGLCLPSFWVANQLLGLGADFPRALKAVLVSGGTVGLALLGFSPVTVFWYATSDDYGSAVVFNGIVFLAATGGGQIALSRHYAFLVARDARHRLAQVAWLALYAFVAIQLAWVLRPFVGNPSQPTGFFREEALGNAYVEVARLLAGVLF